MEKAEWVCITFIHTFYDSGKITEYKIANCDFSGLWWRFLETFVVGTMKLQPLLYVQVFAAEDSFRSVSSGKVGRLDLHHLTVFRCGEDIASRQLQEKLVLGAGVV